MTDVKIIEKGVFRAWLKIFAVIIAIYGAMIGGYFGFKKLKNKWKSEIKN